MQIDLNVNTKRFKCHLSLKDKLTIIVGDSGEGKSTLVNKLESSYEGIVISEDYVPVILTSNLFYAFKRKYDRQQKYSSLKEFWSVNGNFPIEHSIIILDDNDIVKSEEFKIFFEVSKTNYFLVINRNSKLKIPCDVKSIYKMVSKGIEHKLVSI